MSIELLKKFSLEIANRRGDIAMMISRTDAAIKLTPMNLGAIKDIGNLLVKMGCKDFPENAGKEDSGFECKSPEGLTIIVTKTFGVIQAEARVAAVKAEPPSQ